MMPSDAARRRDVRDLEAERAGATIDEHDPAGELTRRVRIGARRVGAADALAAVGRRIEHRAFDGRRQRSGPRLEHRAAVARDRREQRHELQRAPTAPRSARRSSAEDAAPGEPVMNCLSALLPADATVSTPTCDGGVDRRRQVVVERLAVRANPATC